MRTRNIRVRTQNIEKKNPHALNPSDINLIPEKLTTIHADNSGSLEKPIKPKRIVNSESAQRENIRRHSELCRICRHAHRQEIEHDFVAWVSPAKIAVAYKLSDRSSVYRHANALNLFPKRRRNNRAVLERIMERVDEVKVTASAIVAAALAHSKINARGELIERDENLTFHDLFDRMTSEQLDAYSKHRILPSWFKDEILAAGGRVPEEDTDE
jgi:hypothetical protein